MFLFGTRHDHRPAIRAIALIVLIELALPRLVHAADICTAASNTISTVQLAADRCDLGAGESVDITATGSIPYTGTGDAGTITISGNLSGISDDGIVIEAGGSLAGDIVISGTVTASDDAIFSSGAMVGIVNTGTVTATSGDAVQLDGSSTLSGSFLNDSAFIGGDDAVILDGTIAGSVINNGSITGQGDDGMVVGGTLNNGLTNRGTITSDGDGIIVSGTITGDITNTGTVDSGDDAIQLDGGTVFGNITNSNSILANENGIYLKSGGTVTGSIVNTQTVVADRDGIELETGNIDGSLVNSGTITAQTLTAIDIRSTSVITGDIDNSGTIQGVTGIAIDNSSVGGVVNQAGAIIRGSADAITVASPTAAVTIDNAGLLDGDVSLADGTLNLNGASARVDGAISGQAGSIVNVNDDFATEGSIAVGTLAVASEGVLSLNNDVTALNAFTNAGEVRITNGANRNLTGDYTQAAGGILAIDARSSSDYSQLIATGTLNLAANTGIEVDATGGDFRDGDVLDGVLQGASLGSSGFNVTDNLILIDFDAVLDGNEIDLIADQQSVVDITGDVDGAAAVLDQLIASSPSGDALTLVNALNSLATTQALNNAIDNLTPLFDGGHARGHLIVAKSGATKVIADRLSDLATHPKEAGTAPGHWLWVETFGSRTGQSRRDGKDGYDVGTVGTAFGVDAPLRDGGWLGVSLSYADSSIDGRGHRDHRIDLETAQATLHGTRILDRRTRFSFLGAVGQSWNDGRRSIRINTLDRQAKSSYRSWHMIAGIEAAKRYIFPGVIEVIPKASATYSFARADAYQEKGAGAANLDVKAASADSLDLGLHTTFAYHIASDRVVSANTGVTYDLLASADKSKATLQAGGSRFASKGIEPAAFGVVGGLKLDLLPRSGIVFSAGYNIEIRDDRIGHGGEFRLSLPF